MAVTNKWYGKAMLSIMNKEVDFNDGNVKVGLVTSSYTFDQDTHDYYNDITNEVSSSGTGYTTGGAAIGTPTVTYTGATNVANFDGDDVTWSSSTITARGAFVYYNTGTSSTSPLLCFIDFGEDKSSSASDFKITWDSAGICKITVS